MLIWSLLLKKLLSLLPNPNMGVLVNENTRVIVQGITGRAGSRHTKTMLEYGTKIVAGVRPGAAGEEVHGIPVYNTVSSALEEHDANASILFVPPNLVKGAALEAIEAGIKLVVIVAEHVPLHDTLEIIDTAQKFDARVIGPNTPGLISPKEKCKLGFLPDRYVIPGPVGILSRSGTSLYEILYRLSSAGIGQSTCIGVGGDPVVGMSFKELLPEFEEDPETKVILLVGEIGGTMEEDAAELIKKGKITKPVVAFLAGYSVPPGRQVGHAGAIITGEKGSIESKLKAFKDAGVKIAETPWKVVDLIKESLKDVQA